MAALLQAKNGTSKFEDLGCRERKSNEGSFSALTLSLASWSRIMIGQKEVLGGPRRTQKSSGHIHGRGLVVQPKGRL